MGRIKTRSSWDGSMVNTTPFKFLAGSRRRAGWTSIAGHPNIEKTGILVHPMSSWWQTWQPYYVSGYFKRRDDIVVELMVQYEGYRRIL